MAGYPYTRDRKVTDRPNPANAVASEHQSIEEAASFLGFND
jgi:hypothetical protein